MSAAVSKVEHDTVAYQREWDQTALVIVRIVPPARRRPTNATLALVVSAAAVVTADTAHGVEDVADFASDVMAVCQVLDAATDWPALIVSLIERAADLVTEHRVVRAVDRVVDEVHRQRRRLEKALDVLERARSEAENCYADLERACGAAEGLIPIASREVDA